MKCFWNILVKFSFFCSAFWHLKKKKLKINKTETKKGYFRQCLKYKIVLHGFLRHFNNESGKIYRFVLN